MTADDSAPSSQDAATMHDLKFEEALTQLEQIVQRMEGGRLPLDESLAAYRRGSELLRLCHQQLSEAERQIQILDNGSLRDFEIAGGEGR